MPPDRLPTVTVIVPLYKGLAFIDRSLGSIRRQTLEPLEVILVDDHSPDGTADVAAERYPEMRLIRLSWNLGPAGARDHAAAEARGEALAFLDQDDEWHPDYLARQTATLAGDPEAVLAHADLILSDGHKRQLLIPVVPDDPVARRRLFLLERNPLPSMTMVIVRAGAYRSAGGLVRGLTITHDRMLYFRLSPLGAFRRTEGALCAKHQHGANLMRSRGLEEWREDGHRFLDLLYADPANADLKPLEPAARAGVERRVRAAAAIT